MSLKTFNEKLATELGSIQQLGPNDPMWRYVSILCQSGQHLRPELVRQLLVGTHPHKRLSTAFIRDTAALELVHCSTLIHDDIIDKGKERRGLSTLNVLYGNEIALLLGNMVKDYALSIASVGAVLILNEASLDVNLGQLKETQARELSTLPLADCAEIGVYKCGRMFRHCVQLAALHGANVDMDAQEAFEAIGTLYQIADDWLDLFDSTAVTRKTAGRDVENHVHSYVYAERAEGGCLADLPRAESQQFLLGLSAHVRSHCLETLIPNMVPAAGIAAGYLDRIDQKIRQAYSQE